ncbi:MAG: hypothetical protein AXA67_00380 [Methylothermaceae bacteria B42]|nr:MAG: hypothetical protein AXA67_00380 [Methylothermaceae bacteria B42]HHJ38828.1 DUF4389 domain-containing protein [Methylothermaceae bacterium]
MPTPNLHPDIQKNLKEISTWQRIFYMAVFIFIVGFVRAVLWAIIAFQVVTKLLTGTDNPNVRQLGANLASYHYQIMLFLTFNTDEMPFPFAEL